MYLPDNPGPALSHAVCPLIHWTERRLSPPGLTVTHQGTWRVWGQTEVTLKEHAQPMAAEQGGAQNWAKGSPYCLWPWMSFNEY